MYSISLIGEKGGVGKSTIALLIAQSFAMLQKNILLIDLDPEVTLTRITGSNPSDDLNINRMLRDDRYLEKIIQKTSHYLSIVPGNSDVLCFSPGFLGDSDHLQALKSNVSAVESRFDYVIIDSPPEINPATENAVIASDLVVFPVVSDLFSEKQVEDASSYMKKMKNKSASCIWKVLFSSFDSNCKMSVDTRLKIMDKFDKNVFSSVVPVSQWISDSNTKLSMSDNMFSKTSHSFLCLTKEIMDYEKIKAR